MGIFFTLLESHSWAFYLRKKWISTHTSLFPRLESFSHLWKFLFPCLSVAVIDLWFCVCFSFPITFYLHCHTVAWTVSQPSWALWPSPCEGEFRVASRLLWLRIWVTFLLLLTSEDFTVWINCPPSFGGVIEVFLWEESLKENSSLKLFFVSKLHIKYLTTVLFLTFWTIFFTFFSNLQAFQIIESKQLWKKINQPVSIAC